MGINLLNFVTKISVSNMTKAIKFYTNILGFEIQDEYTINENGDYGTYSYVQMVLDTNRGNGILIGLFVDIDKPFDKVADNGTVPSFIVEDLDETLKYLQSHQVKIDPIEGVIIQENISDHGKTDRFFFFQDLDRNSLVARQNMN